MKRSAKKLRALCVVLAAVSAAFAVVAEDTSICSVEDGCADCTEAFQKRLESLFRFACSSCIQFSGQSNEEFAVLLRFW